jgi:hypothetical protein
MSDILEEIAKFILWVIVDIFLICTGEIVLYVITFGRRKPRWDLYAKEKSYSRFYIFTELSMYVGLAFWIIVIVLVRKYFFGD